MANWVVEHFDILIEMNFGREDPALAALRYQGSRIFRNKSCLGCPVALSERQIIPDARSAPFQAFDFTFQPEPRRDFLHNHGIEVLVRNSNPRINHEAAQHVAAAPGSGADK